MTLSTPTEKLIELFAMTAFPRFEPRFNIAPTQRVTCVRLHEGIRQAAEMKWGLIPSWAKDPSIGNRMINARSETAATKPSFRAAWKRRRCLIPVDGFYEWEKLANGKKQPWWIHSSEKQPLAFAGLWETWQPKNSEAAEEVLSCSILTTAANADMSPIHDRMPVIVTPTDFATWLSESPDVDQLADLTQPSAAGTLDRYRVSTLVNKPINDSVECIAPLADAPESGAEIEGTLFS